MKKYRVFTIHPIYQLDEACASEEIARRKADSHKKTYPNIPVYLQTIEEV